MDIYKYKAQLNLYASKMCPGFCHNQIYAPVVDWYSIRILLSTLLRNNRKTI